MDNNHFFRENKTEKNILPENLEQRMEKAVPLIEKDDTREDKEKAVKEEIKDYLDELQKVPSFASPVKNRDETDEIIKLPPNQQVGALISLVFEKGIEKAVSIACSLDNPAILDEFHDVLIDRYYSELIEKNILK